MYTNLLKYSQHFTLTIKYNCVSVSFFQFINLQFSSFPGRGVAGFLRDDIQGGAECRHCTTSQQLSPPWPTLCRPGGAPVLHEEADGGYGLPTSRDRPQPHPSGSGRWPDSSLYLSNPAGRGSTSEEGQGRHSGDILQPLEMNHWNQTKPLALNMPRQSKNISYVTFLCCTRQVLV